jgi:hydroxypyruvate isomerase
MSNKFTRREALGAVAAIGLTPKLMANESTTPEQQTKFKHSVCKWCYGGMTLDQLCIEAKRIGLQSVELLSENEWATVKKHGLTCAVANGPTSIGDGWNNPALHDKFVQGSEKLLPLVAEAGIPQMIVFSGNRRGMWDSDGLENCAKGLKRIMPLAEKLGVTVIMELLNSKVDHKDYMCDHTEWGVNLCKAVGSDRFKLLYDIYHMQIMEGDVIRTIEKHHQYIGHYHTGGNPGRNEIDETQELNYRRIAQAIADTGFKGYLGQEFIPRKDPMKSLEAAYKICSV